MTTLILFLTLMQLPAAGEAVPRYYHAPYRETNQDGVYMEWGSGESGVVGRVSIMKDLSVEIFKRMTQQEAEDRARTRILKALGDVRIDSEARVADRPDMISALRRQLEAATAERTDTSRGYFEAVLKFPWRGQEGLVSLALNTLALPATGATEGGQGPAATAAAETAAPYTGLIIDARHLTGENRLIPALLPRVLDPGGRVLYGPSTPDPQFARESGLAAYMVRLIPRPGAPVDPTARPREGARPLEVTASGSKGKARTDLVVSSEDAAKILSAADSGFLSEARVVILMPPPAPPPAHIVPRHGQEGRSSGFTPDPGER